MICPAAACCEVAENGSERYCSPCRMRQLKSPQRLEHTPSKFAPLVHIPEGGHRSNTYWDVCGFFVRETFSIQVLILSRPTSVRNDSTCLGRTSSLARTPTHTRPTRRSHFPLPLCRVSA
jgi:hypothetical protein